MSATRSIRPGLAAAALLVALAAGRAAGQEREAPPAVRPGTVLTVEGIGGIDMLGHNAAIAFRKAGLPHEVRRFNWTHGTGRYLKDLQDTENLFKKADELAEELLRLRREDPDRPVYVVAKSAGTGAALFALERLPPGTVDRVILISPAVSPTFDLRRALRATRGEIVSFHSRNDQFILNWGTSHFGTADRHYGPGAGLYGFQVPGDLDEEGRALYRRLVQVGWTPRMLLEGYPGTHAGTSQPGFLGSEVAPWLR
jgi:pimeloyl-ACP methyl ester carboxylesterase